MKALAYYKTLTENPSAFPLSFTYGCKNFRGFPQNDFSLVEQSETTQGEKRTARLSFRHENLRIDVELNLYENYDAIEYTVFFSPFFSEKTDVLRKVYALDYTLPQEYSSLFGMLGDHKNAYREYQTDLRKTDVSFVSDMGRPTHIYAPYFQLSSPADGIRMALGWCGTWKASFSRKKKNVTVKMQGCLGLDTYLLPNEKIRTPQVVFLFFEGNDGTNAWRKWMRECVFPKQDGKPIPPFSTVFYAMDTGKPNSDGSISESYESYARSMDAFYREGLSADFRWFDAGWYCDPDGNTVERDWSHTIGSWELDKVKWPEKTFLESVLYARKHNTKTLVWFEPERLTHTPSLIKNYGLQKDWILYSQPKSIRFWLNKNIRELLDLGNPNARKWALNRILSFFDRNDIDMYREDFNTDPASFWRTTDKKLGRHRKGITENKYVQGHYLLWDEILAYCKEHRKCTFLDVCASGGGRNDIESLRRAVPILRSDRDRTTIDVRLSMTTSLCKWIPFNGAVAKESDGELDNGFFDVYVLRASYLPVFSLSAAWSLDPTLSYPLLRQAQEEWNRIKEYFFYDFYVLTPYNEATDNTRWTVYEYLDGKTQKGVLQAFRPPHCKQNNVLVSCQGIEPNRSYRLQDVDGEERILSGKDLTSFTIRADTPRKALILYFSAL